MTIATAVLVPHDIKAEGDPWGRRDLFTRRRRPADWSVDVMIRKYLVVADGATNSTISIADVFIFGEFENREAATRFARSRGLRLTSEPSRQPDPPIAASDTAG